MSVLTPSPGISAAQLVPDTPVPAKKHLKAPKPLANGQKTGQTRGKHSKLGHGLRIKAGLDAQSSGEEGWEGGTPVPHPRAEATFPEAGMIPEASG